MIPDHLPATGIVCETQEELVSFCHRVIQKGTAIQVPEAESRLVRYELADGVHIWMYVNPGNEVERLFSFYYPVSSHHLEVARFIEEDGDRSNLLVGGWLLDKASQQLDGEGPLHKSSTGKTAQERKYRLSFVCIDAPLYPGGFEAGVEISCQLMGICRKPKLHVDRHTFEQAQQKWSGGKDIQPRTVIPSDVLNLDVDPFFQGADLKPYAYVTGIVRETTVCSDDQLDAPFIHVKLDTTGMTMDVLLADQAVPTTPEQGNVLEGHFLMIGMKKPRGRT